MLCYANCYVMPITSIYTGINELSILRAIPEILKLNTID